MNIFHGFQVFEYALWQKSKTQKSCLDKITPGVNDYHYWKKVTDLLSKYHFGFNNHKSHAEAIIVNDY